MARPPRQRCARRRQSAQNHHDAVTRGSRGTRGLRGVAARAGARGRDCAACRQSAHDAPWLSMAPVPQLSVAHVLAAGLAFVSRWLGRRPTASGLSLLEVIDDRKRNRQLWCVAGPQTACGWHGCCGCNGDIFQIASYADACRSDPLRRYRCQRGMLGSRSVRCRARPISPIRLKIGPIGRLRGDSPFVIV